MRTAVVCLGNELVGDDGVGIRVARVLGKLSLPDTVEVLVRPNLGLDLIELLEQYERVVIVDAMTSGRPPGTCTNLDPSEAAAMASCPSCAHSLGIAEVVQLVKQMFPDRTDRAVRIVGVEAASIDQFGIGLSEPVACALPDAVEAVLRSVGGLDALIAEARRMAEVESRVAVTLEQVLGVP